MDDAAVRVREGARDRPVARPSRLFPPMMIHLISSGESSGELDTMLERAAQHQERELDAILQGVVGLLGPLMILVMGGLVLADRAGDAAADLPAQPAREVTRHAAAGSCGARRSA